MTTMGHSLTGLSLGVLCFPSGRRWWWIALLLNAYVGLSNIPDWPLPGWGHDRYEVSHSLFVNLGLIGIILVVLWHWRVGLKVIGGLRVALGGGLAWLSHLFLDCLYNHGLGLAMFWPLSDQTLALPVPWFSILGETWVADSHTARVLQIEVVCYGALLAVCVIARLLWWRRSKLRSAAPEPPEG